MSESKISHEDSTYLEGRNVCETVDSMLQLACQTKAPEPLLPFFTTIVEKSASLQLRRVQPDVGAEEKLTKSKAWRELETAAFGNTQQMSQLFQGSRADAYSSTLEFAGDANTSSGADKQNFIYYDYSKTNMNDATRNALLSVAAHTKLQAAMEKMKTGEKINTTEKRAVFHIGLRGSAADDVKIDGKNVNEVVNKELKSIERIATAVRDGSWQGASGKSITDVVHIGIGGSILGTQAAVQALSPFGAKKDLNTHFLSSLDGAQFEDVMASIQSLESTLFVVVTKTFTTAETLTVADRCKKLIVAKFDKNAVAKHFVAVSAAPERATAFGIDAANIVAFWDFVGGRFSTWSGVGITLAIACGFDNFKQFLDGAKQMDTHFFNTTDLQKNIPVMMGLLAVLHQNIFHTAAHAVVPYASRLSLFPAYLQQLEMESLGKSVTNDNKAVEVRTSPVIMGGTGPEAQHSFFQLLHQGSTPVSIDFIGAIQAQQDSENAQQAQLAANMFAQSLALMNGRTRNDVHQALAKTNEQFTVEALNHRILPGSKPSCTFLLKKITPMTLGALFAAYEHKVFVQAAIWNINGFDQYGVEEGKKIAERLVGQLGKDKGIVTDNDNSTNALVNLFNKYAQ